MIAAAKKLDGAMSLALGIGDLDLLDGAGAEEVAPANPPCRPTHRHASNPTHLHPHSVQPHPSALTLTRWSWA